MKKQIPVIKDEVEEIVSDAFNIYQRDRIKSLKSNLFKYENALKEAQRRRDECQEILDSITTEELWTEFLEYNVMIQGSKYEEALK